jgi:hypothetical protein
MRLGSVTLPLLLALLAAGCSTSNIEQLNRAISDADREAGDPAAKEVLRQTEDGEILIIQSAKLGVPDQLLLLVFDENDPSHQKLSLVTAVSRSDPVNVFTSVANGKLWIYGLVNDPRIARLRLDNVEGGQSLDVSPPAFLFVRTPPGSSNPWQFIDSAGPVITSGGQ